MSRGLGGGCRCHGCRAWLAGRAWLVVVGECVVRSQNQPMSQSQCCLACSTLETIAMKHGVYTENAHILAKPECCSWQNADSAG